MVDLLVIGAGMAGLTAAARAARDGLSVTVVEVSGEVGGSARFAGYAWTAPSHEVMTAQNPNGDKRLRHALVDRFAAGVDWIREIGVETGAAQRILSFGRGHRFDTNHYVDTCRRIVLDAGGTVLLDTDLERLVIEDGRVVGAGDIRATSTLLATGGFQGDLELRAAHVHPAAGRMQLRANPHSRGGGYRLATQAGAATGPENAGFYGHLVPSGVPFADPADFVDLSLYYSEHALLFNLDNERFVDETLGDHLTTMALLDQPESRGLLVADARVFRDWIVGSYVDGAVAVDKFALTSKRGGRAGLAEDLDDLANLPAEWGYQGAAIRDRILSYNETHEPLDEPPYYVVEAAPAITFTFHGADRKSVV